MLDLKCRLLLYYENDKALVPKGTVDLTRYTVAVEDEPTQFRIFPAAAGTAPALRAADPGATVIISPSPAPPPSSPAAAASLAISTVSEEESSRRVYHLKAQSKDERQTWVTFLGLACAGAPDHFADTQPMLRFFQSDEAAAGGQHGYRSVCHDLPTSPNFEPVYVSFHDLIAPDGSTPLQFHDRSAIGRIIIPKSYHVNAFCVFAPFQAGADLRATVLSQGDYRKDLEGQGEGVFDLKPKHKHPNSPPIFYSIFVIQRSELNLIDWQAEVTEFRKRGSRPASTSSAAATQVTPPTGEDR